MSSKKKIRCYDYVNHPYDKVKNILTDKAMAIFKNATLSAASRAQNVAAELHVNIAGIEIGKDISITIKEIEELPREASIPQRTRINLNWAASKNPTLFPTMWGDLTIYPLTDTETQLDFLGEYVVPFGAFGGVLNAMAGHGIAEASVLKFIKDIASHLRTEL